MSEKSPDRPLVASLDNSVAEIPYEERAQRVGRTSERNTSLLDSRIDIVHRQYEEYAQAVRDTDQQIRNARNEVDPGLVETLDRQKLIRGRVLAKEKMLRQAVAVSRYLDEKDTFKYLWTNDQFMDAYAGLHTAIQVSNLSSIVAALNTMKIAANTVRAELQLTEEQNQGANFEVKTFAIKNPFYTEILGKDIDSFKGSVTSLEDEALEEDDWRALQAEFGV